MKHVLSVACLLSAAFSLPAAADCRSIVSATLAELEAAYPDWDERMETLARTAAGSACVKASTATAVPAPQIEEQAVSASATVAPMAPASASAAVVEESNAATETAATEASAAASDDDSGWNPFKEIKFNKVSASPNKKPYERRRDVNNTAPSAEDSE